jgi:DNA-binding NarL/FixJ family response regulator
VHDEDAVRRAALAAGADAFVLKREIATNLLPAIERVRTQVTGPGTGESR